MLNAGKYQDNKQTPSEKPKIDVKALYEMYRAEKRIFHLKTEEHFNELNLQFTHEIMELARQERMNQLIGSNQKTILQLLNAYEGNKLNDPMLELDRPKLKNLANQIAVYQQFKQTLC